MIKWICCSCDTEFNEYPSNSICPECGNEDDFEETNDICDFELNEVNKKAKEIYDMAEEYNLPLLDSLMEELTDFRNPYLNKMKELENNPYVAEYLQAMHCSNTITHYISCLCSFYPK